MISFTPRSPRRIRCLRKSVQNGSALEGPALMPSTSRPPLVLTATAIITATDTMPQYVSPTWAAINVIGGRVAEHLGVAKLFNVELRQCFGVLVHVVLVYP